jgi:hypothetical protein
VEKTIFLYSHYIAVARNPGCKIEDGGEVVLDLIQCPEEEPLAAVVAGRFFDAQD